MSNKQSNSTPPPGSQSPPPPGPPPLGSTFKKHFTHYLIPEEPEKFRRLNRDLCLEYLEAIRNDKLDQHELRLLKVIVTDIRDVVIEILKDIDGKILPREKMTISSLLRPLFNGGVISEPADKFKQHGGESHDR